MNLFAGVEHGGKMAAEAMQELQQTGAIKLAVQGTVVLVVLDHVDGTMFIGGKRAGVWIDAATPANKFELVKGGFRIDIAAGIVAMLTALGMSKMDAIGASVVPQISGPEKTGE